MAVSLTYSLDDPDKKEQRDGFCLQWLPLKIDEATYVVYENVKGQTWDEIKAELTTLLEDPQERYDFFANRNPIIWDGKESFHDLASRIKRKVDKFVSDESRPRECFHRFRTALPLEYRQAIDLRCGDEWEINKAMEIAGRLRIANAKAAAGETGATAAASMEVPLTGAYMEDEDSREGPWHDSRDEND